MDQLKMYGLLIQMYKNKYMHITEDLNQKALTQTTQPHNRSASSPLQQSASNLIVNPVAGYES